MQTDTNKNNDSIKIRIDSTTADLMERARQYVKLDKSKFIRQSVREKAAAIIAEHEKTRFTTDDWIMFFDMLDNPHTPTDRMKKAAEKYKNILSSDEV